MADAIKERISDAEVELIGGGRGDFIVTHEGARIWDKRGADGRFPEHEDILALLGSS